MAWSAKTQVTNAVVVNSTALQDASTAITLTPGESAHIQVDADLGATSALEVYIQSTLDDSTENWDDQAIAPALTITNASDPNAMSFIISGLYKFRLIYKLNTGTDTVTVSAWYRKDGVSL